MQADRTGRARATRIGVGLLGVTLAAFAGAAATPVAGAGGQDRLSVWDGVYQDEQATRGKDQYEYNCGTCHIHDLSGDSIKDVPPLAGSDFMAQWSGKTVKELLDYMATNMPPDSRGSLGATTYADITAYVLKVNEFPAGGAALGSDPDRLAKAVIEREKNEKK
jgi:mono/diheme cytochrome c family protein